MTQEIKITSADEYRKSFHLKLNDSDKKILGYIESCIASQSNGFSSISISMYSVERNFPDLNNAHASLITLSKLYRINGWKCEYDGTWFKLNAL